MRELLPDIDRWLAEGKSLALATVTQTWNSAPRKVGAQMVVAQDSQISGSVSGGCVEGAVAESALEVIASGVPKRLHFGVADETAWDVGLACGGEIDIFVQPLDTSFYEFVRATLNSESPVVMGTIVEGDDAILGNSWAFNGKTRESFGSAPPGVFAQLESGLATELPQLVEITQEGQSAHLFVNPIPPSPTLIIIGGVHIAIALSKLASPLGYRVIIIDPRRAFGTEERFPEAHQVIQSWPDEALENIELNSSTAVATLTHDPKIDDPALIKVLNSPAFYIGALGSRKTQAKRRQRLLDAGVEEQFIDRIHGPIGLDIGATTPEEIALSIMAEIVAIQQSLRKMGS
ncbi:MAG: XdhC/CoxI family protein [Chloroflexi bacterium]|nr:MAG: XdhC/CoxI family protein [Chloroflexota bacterium]MBL1193752.1 XdhC/CoxI family protein [Chloroflexota bacterium]NOH11045.1 XdhC family protein [Chloroflexota bacterium]